MTKGTVVIFCVMHGSTTLGCYSANTRPPVREYAVPSACDFLSPVRSSLTDPDPGIARREAVLSETLLSRIHYRTSRDFATDELVLLMIRQNPYSPEEAAYVLRTSPTDRAARYKVVHARSEEKLDFKEFGGVPVQVVFTDEPIDAETVKLIESAWGMMTLNSRWPDRDTSVQRMKFGGTVYTFDYFGDNVYGQGRIVEPDKNSCAGTLSNIGNFLMRYADQSDSGERETLKQKIRLESNRLLNQAAPNPG